MPEIKDFLNPKSMMTPGIAGGLAVTMAMPLAVQFGLSFKWIALIVSFLLSLTVVLPTAEVKSNLLKGLYIILNSLVIFSVSMGTGITIDPPPKLKITLQPEEHQSGKAGADNVNIGLLSNLLFTLPAYATDAIDAGSNAKHGREIIESANPEEGNGNTVTVNKGGQSGVQGTDDKKDKIKLEAELKKANEKAKEEEALRLKQTQEIEQYKIRKDKHDARWSW